MRSKVFAEPNVAFQILVGDCLQTVAQIADCSIDSAVLDPPAGISFMGAEWDGSKGGRDAWIEWMTTVMRECYRVMKPGAHGLVWALPRTSHWTATACENAGFEIREKHYHLFGQAMAHGLDASKAIDKSKGAVRKAGPTKRRPDGSTRDKSQWSTRSGRTFAQDAWTLSHNGQENDRDTLPATPEAEQWEGYGTGTKPACEEWIRIRKPLDGTVAENVLKYGTGVLNVDGCRIATTDNLNGGAYCATGRSSPMRGDPRDGASLGMFQPGKKSDAQYKQPTGRWPANVILSHLPECVCNGTREVRTGMAKEPVHEHAAHRRIFAYKNRGRTVGYANEKGTETVESWDCAPGCPVAELDRQSGMLTSGRMRPCKRSNRKGFNGPMPECTTYTTNGDAGGASRFFYCAKPSAAEKDVGCEDLLFVRCKGGVGWRIATREEFDAADEKDRDTGNIHPTVKSVDFMRWNVRLVTPAGGTVLDLFTGSGSTGCAAVAEELNFIGCEQSPEYAEIARRRIAWWLHHPGGVTKEARREAAREAGGQIGLFDSRKPSEDPK